jgi:hypothetical protein
MSVIAKHDAPRADDPTPITIRRDVLQIVFDAAVNSLDFGSGFLDDEEVEGLRAVAVALGVDPMVATPFNFKQKYPHAHEWQTPVASWQRQGRWCRVCDAVEPPAPTTGRR